MGRHAGLFLNGKCDVGDEVVYLSVGGAEQLVEDYNDLPVEVRVVCRLVGVDARDGERHAKACVRPDVSGVEQAAVGSDAVGLTRLVRPVNALSG